LLGLDEQVEGEAETDDQQNPGEQREQPLAADLVKNSTSTP
jgi:hypothetical protein